MKIKYFISLCFLILISSCDPLVLEDDIRILVEGTIEDTNGLPISNAQILVYANKGNGFPTPAEIDKKILGSNFSNADGSFSVTSILARDDAFTVEVRLSENYSFYVYETNTRDYVPTDLVFNIPVITLNQLSDVNYNLTRTSDEDSVLDYSFTYPSNFCFELYEEGEINLDQSYCPLDQTFGQNADPSVTGSFNAPFGSEIQFNYRLGDGDTQTETFIINQQNYVFDFSY